MRSDSGRAVADRVAEMATQTTPVAVPAPGDVSIGDLIARSAELKRELVAFAQSPRFASRLGELLTEAADRRGYLDEGTAVLTIDHFALQGRLPDGGTVIERFIAQRRPRLSDAEREMVLGWRDVVEACFEVRRFDGDAVELHNLLDDLVYRVYSNMGRGPFSRLRKRMFVIGRIVPIHPSTDAWLVSGHFAAFPESAGHRIALSASRELTAHPELLLRNPALLRRGWEIQAGHRAEFIAQVGSDLVVLPPHEARETLREHHRRLRQKAVARLDDKAAKRAEAASPGSEELGRLPEELLDADSVALIYDEVEGLCFYRDFGRLDALFADPTLARDRTNLAQLREYLQDDSVSPLAIRRLVQRHPDGADLVFRGLLRKPSFTWSRDGEKLLRRYKESFYDREPLPSISVVGERLTELLRTR